MTVATAALPTAADRSTGGRLVSQDGRELPLRGAGLTATARNGVVRAVLEQRFLNPFHEPLAVTYLFPLPHAGAVSGFAFLLGGHRSVGEVDRLAAARERYEEAIAEGRTAALVEQLRGSLFVQELGNVPPGETVVVELTLDQRLDWLPEGAWEWRFPTAVAPRYQGGPGRVPDARRAEVDVVEDGVPARLRLELTVADALAEGGRVESSSHEIAAERSGAGQRVRLAAEGGVPLDRDVAIQWPVATAEVGVSIEAARPGGRLAGRAFGLLTVVPPGPGAVRALARDLVVLLDTSGSMSGLPLQQARAVVAALVRSLGAADRLELIEFSDSPRRWRPAPEAATAEARREALRWLQALEAGGSTEMATALMEALRPLREEAQRQVVLVTDGHIGFEAEVLRTGLDRLPPGSRLHTVAVGAAPNRSLTTPAARAGRGVELVVELEADPEVAARRLLARMVAPAVTGLTVTGSALRAAEGGDLPGVAPARPPDLFAGAPVLVGVELRPEGGTLTVSGRTPDGIFERTLHLLGSEVRGAEAAAASPIPALFAREAVEDLELLAAGGRAPRVDALVERLGLDFQISTRLTSWVAVSGQCTVDPRETTRRVRVPQQLPHGMSVAGLGLRQAAAFAPPSASEACARSPAATVFDHEFPSEFVALMERGGHRTFHQSVPPGPTTLPTPRRAPGATPPAPSRRARLVLRKGRRLVIELEVTGEPLDWEPGAEATVWLGILVAGGGFELEACQAAVDAAATTAAGAIPVGRTVRLVLVLPQDAPGGSVAHVQLGGIPRPGRTPRARRPSARWGGLVLDVEAP